MIDQPFLTLSRGFFEHPLWSEPRVFSRAEAWLDCVRSAAWRQHRRVVGGSIIDIPRGGIVASERFLSDRWQWSRTKVRQFIDLLAEERMIERKKDHEVTLILLCNFEKYNVQKDRQKTTKEPPKDQGSTKEKEDIEEEKDPHGAPAPTRPLVILPTLDQAKSFAPSAGVSPEAAESWWLECDARPLAPTGHFTDRDGRPIARWQSHMTSYGRKWQANDARRAAGRPTRSGAQQPQHTNTDETL